MWTCPWTEQMTTIHLNRQIIPYCTTKTWKAIHSHEFVWMTLSQIPLIHNWNFIIDPQNSLPIPRMQTLNEILHIPIHQDHWSSPLVFNFWICTRKSCKSGFGLSISGAYFKNAFDLHRNLSKTSSSWA